MIPLRMTSMPTAIWSAEYGQSSGGTWINWNSREQGLLTCSAVAFSFDLRQNQFKIFSASISTKANTNACPSPIWTLFWTKSNQICRVEVWTQQINDRAFQKWLVKFNAAKTKSTNFDESLSSSSSNAAQVEKYDKPESLAKQNVPMPFLGSGGGNCSRWSRRGNGRRRTSHKPQRRLRRWNWKKSGFNFWSIIEIIC